MRVWSVKGWFHDANAEKPTEHNLTVGAYWLDSAIDLAVEVWNKLREGISQVERKNIYGVTQILTMDGVESETETQ
jgi:hypothetical protein